MVMCISPRYCVCTWEFILFSNFAKLKFLDDQQFPTKAKSFKYRFLSLNNIHMLLTLALSLVKIRWPWWGLCHLPFDQVQTNTSQNKMPNSHPEICASISPHTHYHPFLFLQQRNEREVSWNQIRARNPMKTQEQSLREFEREWVKWELSVRAQHSPLGLYLKRKWPGTVGRSQA